MHSLASFVSITATMRDSCEFRAIFAANRKTMPTSLHRSARRLHVRLHVVCCIARLFSICFTESFINALGSFAFRRE